MDAICGPGIQHVELPASSFTATADMEACQGAAVARLFDQNVQLESLTQPEIVQRETQKQSEVVDGAGSLNFASQCPSGISPTVGGYTAQCAKCMKWRFIPTKMHFEAIRHSLIERPFLCSSATLWRAHASCDDPFEISPDVHELWAFDKPGIPLPPNGWERLLVLRPAGSIKFADIYYATPSGKKLRSMPELERFLSEHPEYALKGVKLSQFSFFTPRPVDKDHCRKKNKSLTCGEKSTTSEKAAYSKSLPKGSQSSKVGLVPPSFKVVSSNPKLENLKSRKKAVSEVSRGAESQGLRLEE